MAPSRRSSRRRFRRDLPMELVTEVLMRLPVKIVVRFMRVCKAWCSLISSNYFVSLHLSHVQKKDNDSHLLTSYISEKNDQWLLRSVHTYKKVMDRNYHIRIPKHLDELENFDIIRSCDSGLLLLVREYLRPGELILWNPLLGKTHTLPLPPKPIHHYSFGHGFNSLNNDYKVLMISLHPHTSVHIYDLSVRTWRSITDYDANIVGKVRSHQNGVLMEGNIHWISYNEFSSHMLSFDINNEVFNYVMLPKGLYLYSQAKYPVIYREKLGLLNVLSNNFCSLWVMEKDEAPVRWTKLYQVDLSIKLYFPSSCTRIRVLNFNKDGQLLFATKNGDVRLYDFESRKLKFINKKFPYDILDNYSTLYRESLLLI